MARDHGPQTVKCPRCGEQVYRRAIKCPHCDSSLMLDNEVRTRFISHQAAAPAPRGGGVPWVLVISVLVVLAGAAAWFFLYRPH